MRRRIFSPTAQQARRVTACATALGMLLLAGTATARGEGSGAIQIEQVRLVADQDDDDADGTPDAEQARVGHGADLHELPLRPGAARHVAFVPDGSGLTVRLLVDGRPLGDGASLPARFRRVAVQATGPGRGRLRVGSKHFDLRAIAVYAVDSQHRIVDLSRSHASLQRTPPRRPGAFLSPAGSHSSGSHEPIGTPSDPDALRYVLAGVPEDLPSSIHVRSLSAAGVELGLLRDVPLVSAQCPSPVAAALSCVTTSPLRVVAQLADARHPLVARRSIVAELGGAIELRGESGRKLQMIRVGGPRGDGAKVVRRLRGTLRVMLVRLGDRGGAPPMGRDDAEADSALREALGRVNAIWGSCGVSFGPPAEVSVRLIDPPPPHLLVLGCDHGLPASGGRVRFRAGGHSFDVAVPQGMLPGAAARRIAAELRRARLDAQVSDNPPSGAAAMSSADLSVRLADGRLARIEPVRGAPLSTDATLGVCIGYVNLDDGIEHFGDVDAVVGTVEERTLLKAFDDGDPRTIEVYVVSGFGRGGRIGESFIGSDGGVIRNAVLVDGPGLYASRASNALAHELGHVLLDDPGHTDDYGTDTPTRLMDADAAGSTAFGPTRLTLAECAQVVHQYGPDSTVPMLKEWPFEPLPTTPEKAP